eukprot:CAMPEP_0194095190 /NCGR_PEP_ID=MMETSP0149-20130528/56698_1 /TAXON_ID=122233 /ORGANISM="Chaetoceros debilis, Strain MM31A-1" /LENGTH=884 /DNA_ID=CAMNT_0038781127 /DNA_START=311 /DNA_END=2965 /DNA_ORIENTATION=-
MQDDQENLLEDLQYPSEREMLGIRIKKDSSQRTFGTSESFGDLLQESSKCTTDEYASRPFGNNRSQPQPSIQEEMMTGADTPIRPANTGPARSPSASLDKMSLQHEHNSKGCDITELDVMQRQRREEADRRNAELQSISILDKIRKESSNSKEGADRVNFIQHPFPQNVSLLSRRKADFRAFEGRPSLMNIGTENRSSNYSSFPETTMMGIEDSSFQTSISRIGKKRAAPPPPPRLNIRPHAVTNSFRNRDREQPVIIGQEKDCSDNLVELFPSPHSNKFVLQFPNAPLQELMLDDESEHSNSSSHSSHKDDFQDDDNGPISMDSSAHEVGTNSHASLNSPIRPAKTSANSSKTNTPISFRRQGDPADILYEEMQIQNQSPSTTTSSSNSPIVPTHGNLKPRQRGGERRKKILLRPKNYQGEIVDAKKTVADIGLDVCGVSPCPSFNSSSTADNAYASTSNNIKAAKQGDCAQLRPKGIVEDGNQLEKLANDMTLDENNGLSACVYTRSARLPSLSSNKTAFDVATPENDYSMRSDALHASNVASNQSGGTFLSLRPIGMKKPNADKKLPSFSDYSSPSSVSTSKVTKAMPIPSAYADGEDEDVVMELDPNLSISRDCDSSPYCGSSLHSATSSGGNGHRTPQHFRDASFVPTPSPTHSGPRGTGHGHYNRPQQNHQYQYFPPNYGIQEQMQMAKEAAARFGGVGSQHMRTTSTGSALAEDSGEFSPSNLSESNFCTPNSKSYARKRNHWFQGKGATIAQAIASPTQRPEDLGGNFCTPNSESYARKRNHWFQGKGATIAQAIASPTQRPEDLGGADNSDSHGKDFNASTGKKGNMVSLFLPKLFPSASEEDIDSSAPPRNSFFDAMKEAFSPPRMSWSKSPPL